MWLSSQLPSAQAEVPSSDHQQLEKLGGATWACSPTSGRWGQRLPRACWPAQLDQQIPGQGETPSQKSRWSAIEKNTDADLWHTHMHARTQCTHTHTGLSSLTKLYSSSVSVLSLFQGLLRAHTTSNSVFPESKLTDVWCFNIHINNPMMLFLKFLKCIYLFSVCVYGHLCVVANVG